MRGDREETRLDRLMHDLTTTDERLCDAERGIVARSIDRGDARRIVTDAEVAACTRQTASAGPALQPRVQLVGDVLVGPDVSQTGQMDPAQGVDTCPRQLVAVSACL